MRGVQKIMIETRFNIGDFPFFSLDEWEPEPRKVGNQGSRYTGFSYLHNLSAFDIETSRDPVTDQSWLYQWQWAFEGIGVLMGRTWAEFKAAVDEIEKRLHGRVLVVLVHNLSYEFNFLRQVHEWAPDEVFAVRNRKVVKARWGDLFEFRCTYIHSNMSLAIWTEKMKVEHKKLDGDDYGYNIIRYSDTPLTADELAYCANDVLGVIEAYRAEMDRDGDVLYTIPLTSTGYVRRDVKRALHPYRTVIQAAAPTYRTYQALKEAFRGGLTHANRYFVGCVLHDVKSWDRSSSYPDVLCNCPFPVGKFRAVRFRKGATDRENMEHVAGLIREGKAVLLRVAFFGLALSDQLDGFPYLSFSKCRHVSRGVSLDNGRVLQANYLETTITDIDYKIICRQYKFSKAHVMAAWWAHYGELPGPLRQTLVDYYKMKNALKDLPGEENAVLYEKSKNLLNGIYGLMAQDPVKHNILFDPDYTDPKTGAPELWRESDEKDDEQLLFEATKRMFTLFQWGCWCTAWARFRLMEGVWLAEEQGADCLYVDTDSCKYIGNVDWTEYNEQRKSDSEKSGAVAEDATGKLHYMGVYEQEKGYTDFIMLRSKCYAYIKTGSTDIETTIAGVSKKKGGPELKAAGGLEKLAPGFVFTEAAGLESVYNDDTPVQVIEREGHMIEMGPNVCLRPSSYTVQYDEDYATLLETIKNGLTGPGGVPYT